MEIKRDFESGNSCYCCCCCLAEQGHSRTTVRSVALIEIYVALARSLSWMGIGDPSIRQLRPVQLLHTSFPAHQFLGRSEYKRLSEIGPAHNRTPGGVANPQAGMSLLALVYPETRGLDRKSFRRPDWCVTSALINNVRIFLLSWFLQAQHKTEFGMVHLFRIYLHLARSTKFIAPRLC